MEPFWISARFSLALPSTPSQKILILISPLVRASISFPHHLSTCAPAVVSVHWLLMRSVFAAKLAVLKPPASATTSAAANRRPAGMFMSSPPCRRIVGSVG